MGKKERDELKRRIKGVPGQYVQNQKAQVFEDRRTKRMRSRSEKRRIAIIDAAEETTEG
jgi:hypothetical protein